MTISGQERTGKVYRGAFFGWFETGLEGMVWALQSEKDDSLKGVVVLDESDYVEICGPDGAVVFAGTIRPDYIAGKAMNKLTSARDQPTAMGYWIHWTQEGFEPEEWARYFIPGGKFTGYVRKARNFKSR